MVVRQLGAAGGSPKAQAYPAIKDSSRSDDKFVGMKRYLRTAISLCILSALSLLVWGCLNTAGPAPGGSVSGISNPIPAPSLQGSNGFTFLGTDFFVNVQNPAGTTMYLHQDGNWSQPCKATIGEAPQDMSCILEAEELDLYTNGTNLIWQGPQEQCAYVTVNPYHFYRFAPGNGPAFVTANQTINNGVTGPIILDGYAGGTTQAYVNSQNSLTCSSDYSGNPVVAGPNCCIGQYILAMTTTTISNSGTTITTSVTQNTWGGKASACLEGPAMDSQPIDAFGFPERTIDFLEGGTVNQNYTVKSPISKPYVSNAYAANYFCPGGFCPSNGGTAGTYSLVNSEIPAQIQSGFDQIKAPTASTTAGSNVVALGMFGGISPGMLVTDTGGAIPPGTTVTSFSPGNGPSQPNPGSVTLSNTATLTFAVDTLIFSPAQTPAPLQGTVTNGTNVITNAVLYPAGGGEPEPQVGTTAFLADGMGLFDTGGFIPAGTTITSFFLGNPSTINMSNNATGTLVGDNIYVGNVTGTVATGSKTITNATVLGSIVPGMEIADSAGAIPAGTTVTSVTIGAATATITMNVAATANVAGDVISISSGPIFVSQEASPWFEFDCVDNAYGYDHRLRVMVRSWTQNSAFDLVAGSGNPFIFGPQGPPFLDVPEANFATWPLERAANGSIVPGFLFTGWYPYPAFGL